MSGVVDLSPGAIFAEQFKVIRPLARGGMGAVYVVEQLGTARERALKLMHPQIASDEKSIERFQREAQVASKIDSDHVVEVIAAGVERTSSTPWLCMELLKGETLDDRVQRTGRLSRQDAIEVVKQLGHALSAAHRAGIVHRDLKPENIFLAAPRREGVPFTLKVLDFGVAALVADAQGAKTTQGVGSPMWMAPEQTNVGRVTTATDVWALGLIAFYLLTGKAFWKAPTIEGSSLTALLVEMMVEEMPPATKRAEELLAGGLVPPAFDAWFARAVDRDPNKRFPDAAAALPELIAILEGSSASVAAFEKTAVASALPVTRTVAATAPTAPVAAPPPPSSGWKWAVAGLAVLGLLGVGSFAMMGGSPPPTAAAVVAAPPTTVVPIAAPTTAVDQDESEADDEADDESDEDESEVGDESPPDDDSESEDESEDDDDDDESGDDGDDASDDGDEESAQPAPPPRPRPRPAPTSAAAAAARRMVLDACWRGQFEGETPPPPARWTFDFTLDGSGTASNVRITGPSGGPYTAFRACVVSHVGQYHAPDGTSHVALTLP